MFDSVVLIHFMEIIMDRIRDKMHDKKEFKTLFQRFHHKLKEIIMKKRIRDKIVSVVAFGMALIVGANALAETHQFVKIVNPYGIEFLYADYADEERDGGATRLTQSIGL